MPGHPGPATHEQDAWAGCPGRVKAVCVSLNPGAQPGARPGCPACVSLASVCNGISARKSVGVKVKDQFRCRKMPSTARSHALPLAY